MTAPITAATSTDLSPASGEVRVKGVRSCSNAVLHPWLRAELTAILATLPESEVLPPEVVQDMGRKAVSPVPTPILPG